MNAQEKMKIAAFGLMGIAFVWLVVGLSGKGNLLNEALDQIKSARTEIQSAKTDIGGAKITIDSAQKVLGVLRSAAEIAQKDLDKLRIQREKINADIVGAIANSKQDLKKYGNSIQDLLNEQSQMIQMLDSVDIKTLIVVPAKHKK